MSEEVEYYEGSGNVFADIGLESADELLARHETALSDILLRKQKSPAGKAHLYGGH
jgi:hypothetical protein